jgi:hypothetical protein
MYCCKAHVPLENMCFRWNEFHPLEDMQFSAPPVPCKLFSYTAGRVIFYDESSTEKTTWLLLFPLLPLLCMAIPIIVDLSPEFFRLTCDTSWTLWRNMVLGARIIFSWSEMFLIIVLFFVKMLIHKCEKVRNCILFRLLYSMWFKTLLYEVKLVKYELDKVAWNILTSSCFNLAFSHINLLLLVQGEVRTGYTSLMREQYGEILVAVTLSPSMKFV